MNNGEKNNKKIIAGIVVAVVLIMVAIIGIISYQNDPGQRLKKQISLGDRYLSELRYEDAIAAYEAALQIDAKSEAVYVGITKAYIGIEDYDKALDSLNLGIENVGETEALIALQNLLADYYEALGDQYMSEMNYEHAVVAYVAVLGIKKGEEEPYVDLANAYLGEEEYSKALDTVEEGIADVGATPKLIELKTKIEELLNPPVEDPKSKPKDTVLENVVEEEAEEEPQETQINTSVEEQPVVEANPTPEEVPELVAETPNISATPVGRTVALADGSAVASGGTILSSQLTGASYIMEGNRWFACFVDTEPYFYANDPYPNWAFEGRYSSGTPVPLAQCAAWGAGAGDCITIITAIDNGDESTYHESFFYIR